MTFDDQTANDLAAPAGIGHNTAPETVRFIVKGFNSISPYVEKTGAPMEMTMPFGSTLKDLVALLNIPDFKIFLAMKNGRDVTTGLYPSQKPVVNLKVEIEEGDHISFSGPVPYSYGYGSPVV